MDLIKELKNIKDGHWDENSFGAIDRCISVLQNCIDGYVARDKNGDLYFHYIKPHRENEFELTWWGSTDANFWISDDDFPEFKDLKWEDEPLKVRIAIKKV